MSGEKKDNAQVSIPDADNPKTQDFQAKKGEESQSVKHVDDPKFGAWMVAAPRKPRKPNNSQKSQAAPTSEKLINSVSTSNDQNGKGEGLRYAILAKDQEFTESDNSLNLRKDQSDTEK